MLVMFCNYDILEYCILFVKVKGGNVWLVVYKVVDCKIFRLRLVFDIVFGSVVDYFW